MPQRPKIDLAKADAESPWADDLRAQAERALDLAEARLGVGLDAPPLVESKIEADFYEALGRRPHNLVAVAVAGENRVLINRSRFFETGASERGATLLHEFSHLIIGRRVPGGVPRWLDEGIAMLAAREAGFSYHTRLAAAASFGRLLPLDSMWSDPASQELAYAQSLSASRYLVRTFDLRGDDEEANLKALARKLADFEEGKSLRSLLHDPNFLGSFERRWRESIRSVWTWVAALTGGGALWGLASLLFLFAYWRKRRMAELKEKEWEEEEAFPYDEEAFEKLEEYLEEEE